jgi:lipopolysaccharide export LptBFGC system permease protein LptF
MEDSDAILETPIHQKLARTSWICPIVMMIIISMLGNLANGLVGTALSVLFSIVGLTSGFTALAGIRRHGRAKILVPAVIGIGINAFFVWIWVTNS